MYHVANSPERMAPRTVLGRKLRRCSTTVAATTVASLKSARAEALVALLVVGAALILPRLGNQSLWLDERLTIGPAVTATSVEDLVAQVRAVDTQPPASHLVLYALRDFLPQNEFFYRLPSFVAVELGLIAMYLFVRRLWGPVIAWTATACAQLSPFLCFYAAEARNYGLWFLCVTLSALLAADWYEAARDGRARRAWAAAIALGVVNAVGLWTHLFHAFLILTEVVILVGVALVRPATYALLRQALVSLVAAQLATAALFAPWAYIVARGFATGTAGVSWTRPFTLASLAYYAFAAHFGASLGPPLRTLHLWPFAAIVRDYPLAITAATLAIVVTAATHAALVRDAVRHPERRWELLLLVGWPAVSMAGPLCYAALRHFPLHPRHLLFVWPLLPIVLALGLVRHRRARPALLASLALALVATGNLLFNQRYAKDDERAAVRFAEDHSGPVAYVLGDAAMLYARRAEGHDKGFGDFRRDADDVWLVDNRVWEEQNQHARRRLALEMQAMGMRYEGGTTSFRGIVLRHWTATRS
jgi:uncharacterized membrane protein